MKTRKFTAMLLTLAMAFSLLTVSAGAVMDNDHDRISVDTAGPLSVVWDSETVDSEAYHTGDIVSSEDGYYPSSFYLYVDSAEENGITVTGGTLSAPVEETEGGTKYLVTNNSGGSIVIMERVLLNGETISDAADGHVFTMAAGDMLQIITQTGEEAPYITVLICQ